MVGKLQVQEKKVKDGIYKKALQITKYGLYFRSRQQTNKKGDNKQ
jgi:hypothetical protein